MKNKKSLMLILSIIGGLFGYFCLNNIRTEFRVLFLVAVFIGTIVYIIEGKKNNYNKVSLKISILALMLCVTLFMNDLIIHKYPQFLYLQGNVIALIVVIISLMIIISAIHYIKVSSRRNGVLMIALLSFMILCVIVIIIAAILKSK